VIVSLVKPSLNNVLFALSIAIAPRTSRIVRGETLAVKNNLYVEAAFAVGCGRLRMMRRYILPNILPTILIISSLTMGGAIIAESSLAFLGLTSPTLLDWGGMLSNGRSSMASAWWPAVFPGLAIMITVLAFNLLGDSLRDILDPRLRV
jgi:ABC-type dipeptide/oligopeptide/nickel transport system permease subunit